MCLLYYDFLQPEPEPERKNSLSEKKSSSPNHNGDAAEESGHVPSEYLHFVDLIQKIDNFVNVAVDTNLIQLDTDDMASNTNNTYETATLPRGVTATSHLTSNGESLMSAPLLGGW